MVAFQVQSRTSGDRGIRRDVEVEVRNVAGRDMPDETGLSGKGDVATEVSRGCTPEGTHECYRCDQSAALLPTLREGDSAPS